MIHARMLAHALTIMTGLGAVLAFARGCCCPDRRRELERVRHSDEQTRRAYDLTLETWARTSDVRGGLGEGYSRRVAALAVLLARELGLDDAAITEIRRGALLHDIGNLWVPERVLLKPGPLTPAEREVVERHPTMARDILLDIPLLETALDIPYAHHERWDGQGYPRGLAGEEIPLAARLFTVVDHWEALGAERSYRRAWPKSAALGYLRSSAGTVFDPRMVQAFLRVLERAPRSA